VDDPDDDRANALATAIMSAATCRELLDSADEIVALLADPAPLPPMEGSSIMVIYKRLLDENRNNARLRSRLRQMLAD
jgi:hypothetical protein